MSDDGKRYEIQQMELLKQREKAASVLFSELGPSNIVTAETELSIAETYLHLRRFDEFGKHAAIAYPTLKDLRDTETTRYLRAALIYGMHLFDKQEMDKARDVFADALDYMDDLPIDYTVSHDGTLIRLTFCSIIEEFEPDIAKGEYEYIVKELDAELGYDHIMAETAFAKYFRFLKEIAHKDRLAAIAINKRIKMAKESESYITAYMYSTLKCAFTEGEKETTRARNELIGIFHKIFPGEFTDEEDKFAFEMLKKSAENIIGGPLDNLGIEID